MDPDKNFDDLTTEEKIDHNTKRVQELAARGMVLDPTNLRLGVMLETLLKEQGLMELAETKIQDKLNEEVSEVERQVARATLTGGAAGAGSAVENSGGALN